VLLDYNGAYPSAWSKAFGETPVLADPLAYHPVDRWGVPRLEGTRLEQLRRAFDHEFWSSIEPMPGALEACEKLVNAGFDLVRILVTVTDRSGDRDRFASV
jgi:hypothetical protein